MTSPQNSNFLTPLPPLVTPCHLCLNNPWGDVTLGCTLPPTSPYWYVPIFLSRIPNLHELLCFAPSDKILRSNHGTGELSYIFPVYPAMIWRIFFWRENWQDLRFFDIKFNQFLGTFNYWQWFHFAFTFKILLKQ